MILCVYADHYACSSGYPWGRRNLAGNACGGADGSGLVDGYVFEVQEKIPVLGNTDKETENDAKNVHK